MKIARIRHRSEHRYAFIEDEYYRLIEGDVYSDFSASQIRVRREECTLLSPVEPRQIVGIGLNYRKHADEFGKGLPDAPVLFVKTCNTVVGPEEAIVLPNMAADEVDYEAELVIVIGKQAKNVPVDRADEYILGYTCGNDVSARDCQLKYDKQWARAKCFDTFAPIGPWIETDLDSQGLDANNLRIRSMLNGETMQDSRTSDLIFGCRELVGYVSRCMTLYPGSIIMTGTPEGVGMGRDPQVFLKKGDTVTIEIEGIGRLSNSVTCES